MTKSLFLFTIIFLSFASSIKSQNVGIGTTQPEVSAALDISSSDKGLMIPRIANTTDISNPAIGLLIFDTSSNSFKYYNGSLWKELSDGHTLTDNDGDTKIQPEEIPDEDLIRFDLGGKEYFVMVGPRLEVKNSGNSVFIGNGSGANDDLSNNENVAIGELSLALNSNGFSNSAIGMGALHSNTIGNSNTAVGNKSLYSNTNFDNLVAVGDSTLYNNGLGATETYHSTKNSALGSKALFNNTTGYKNTAVGFQAMYSNTSGRFNVAVGENALSDNSSGFYNVAVGRESLKDNTSGVRNTAIGNQSLGFNTTGDQNTALGNQTLFFNTTGHTNLAAGSNALLFNTSGFFNTAIGQQSLFNNTSGWNNTAIGFSALFHNKANAESTAVGFEAMKNADDRITTITTDNTSIGYRSLFGSSIPANNTGTKNTAMGSEALYNNTSGLGNTGIGTDCLHNNTTGSNNTALGNLADVSANNLTNSTSLGANSITNANNKVRIGNSTVTVIEGQVDWTFPSDARFKFNIQDNSIPGLSFINRLRPVTYQFDTKKYDTHLHQNLPDSTKQLRLNQNDYKQSMAKVHSGFLAQEIEVICQELGFDFSGLHIPESDIDNYSLAYGSFVPVLVKAIQELEQKNLANKTTIASNEIEILNLSQQIISLNELKKENSMIKSRLETLERIVESLQNSTF